MHTQDVALGVVAVLRVHVACTYCSRHVTSAYLRRQYIEGIKLISDLPHDTDYPYPIRIFAFF